MPFQGFYIINNDRNSLADCLGSVSRVNSLFFQLLVQDCRN